MDHQLDEGMNLDSAMLEVSFEPGHTVTTHSHMALPSTSHDEGVPMEFEHVEEQPVLMESGNEEIIGLMGDQFTVGGEQEYSVQDSQMLETTIDSDQSQLLKTSGIMDLQFDTQQLITSTITSKFDSNQGGNAQLIPVKQSRASAPLPRQVAIAPKPAPRQLVLLPGAGGAGGRAAPAPGKQPQGKMFVHTQLGKQYVMMPAQNTQKIKLVQSGGQTIQAQLISGKNAIVKAGQKQPVMAKVIVQSQPRLSAAASEQPAVITKLSGAAQPPRFVPVAPHPLQHNPVLASKVIMASPTKHGIRFSKPSQKVMNLMQSPKNFVSVAKNPAPGAPKLVFNTKPQRVVLKTTIPHQAQTIKLEPGTVVSGSGSQQAQQLHPINIPGKGIQYIRLITNPSSAGAPSKVAAAAAPAAAAPAKPGTFVLSDSKGNIIQVSADKVGTSQPPPLVASGGATLNKVVSKPVQKLVRIAPVSTKTSAVTTMRGQSLLARGPPPSPVEARPPARAALDSEALRRREQSAAAAQAAAEESKEALRRLIEQTVAEVSAEHAEQEDYDERESPTQEDGDDDSDSSQQHSREEHPLIVIPAEMQHEARDLDSSYGVNMYAEAYESQRSPPPGPENNEMDLRPRKACNCTKSQCLKLYCDCFANGEFCNRCNCTNCHNNLENEELRQKAIRGCLDRNPNAFRPKIGKSRNGGPEPTRRHTKGCNCKRSGCLKNYCECYEAKIACTAMCKCVGCRNVEEALERALRREPHPARRAAPLAAPPREGAECAPPPPTAAMRQPCSFMTTEVIEAVCQCLVASASEPRADSPPAPPSPAPADPVRGVIEEFARCLQDIISASHQGPGQGLTMLDEGRV